MENPAVPPAQGRGQGAFAGGPDMETAIRTTGLLTAGRNRGGRTGPACRTVARPAPRFPTRAVRYSARSTGAAGSQRTRTSSPAPRPRTDATAPSRPFGSHPTGWSRRHRRQSGRDLRPGLRAAGSEVGQGELPRRNGLRQGLQQQDALQPAAVHRQRSRAVDLPSPAAQIPTQRKKPTHMDARLGLKHKKGRVHKQVGGSHLIQAMAAPLPLRRSPATFGGPSRCSRIPATR